MENFENTAENTPKEKIMEQINQLQLELSAVGNPENHPNNKKIDRLHEQLEELNGK